MRVEVSVYDAHGVKVGLKHRGVKGRKKSYVREKIHISTVGPFGSVHTFFQIPSFLCTDVSKMHSPFKCVLVLL